MERNGGLNCRCCVLSEEACGKFECLWDDEGEKGCGPRYVSLFGHKIDLAEVKQRTKETAAQAGPATTRAEL